MMTQTLPIPNSSRKPLRLAARHIESDDLVEDYILSRLDTADGTLPARPVIHVQPLAQPNQEMDDPTALSSAQEPPFAKTSAAMPEQVHLQQQNLYSQLQVDTAVGHFDSACG
jgi:hypothetical protein